MLTGQHHRRRRFADILIKRDGSCSPWEYFCAIASRFLSRHQSLS